MRSIAKIDKTNQIVYTQEAMPNSPEENPEIPQQANPESPDAPVDSPAEPLTPDQALDNKFKTIAVVAATTGIAALGASAAIYAIDRSRRKEQQGEKNIAGHFEKYYKQDFGDKNKPRFKFILPFYLFLDQKVRLQLLAHL